MKPKLTIFTPTYNRAYCLHLCYESLVRQTNKNFKWLIVDDGSTDNTKEVVDKWIANDNKFDIEYVYKNNGGLHTGYNKAIELMDTELCVCIDSDDYMPDNGVEIIVNFWGKNGDDNYGGIVGLDFLLTGKSIGGDLPDVKSLYLFDLTNKFKYRGDVKVVYRTALLKKVAPQPIFNNEKNFNPIYLMYLIDKEFPLLVLNENLCFVDYQPNGMSARILKQYIDSPNSFAALRKLYMSMPNATKMYIFRQSIHYVSSSIFARNKNFLSESPQKIFTFLAIPFGVLLNFYLRIKTKTL